MTFSRQVLLSVLLAALTVAALGGVIDNGFIALDDVVYLTGNQMVQEGLSARGVAAAFTSTHQAATWHPLTWISHMLDVELFGMRPGPHHAVGLAIHTANALLLFSLLRSLTGALWRSALVAALFAVHPLHVESVAWAAERKDVLSAFFLLCTAHAYLRAAKRNAVARSVAVPLLFALALMSKAMAVTLPFLLLLLDWWPLNRWTPALRRSAVGSLLPPARLWTEKVPLFLLCAASTATTYVAAAGGGAIAASTPAASRLSNAVVACVSYLGKTIWPHGLSPFYPYPIRGLTLAPVAGAVALLGIITVVVWRAAPRQPYLGVGWLWYLGMLVPVIGLVPAGGHAMADRYTYLPLTGIFVATTWGLGVLLDRHRRLALPAGALALAIVVALVVAARTQAALWRDSGSLFSHALRLDADNWVAWNVLGIALVEQGRREEAAEHFRRSLAISDNADNKRNLGLVLADLDRPREALPYLREAVLIDANDPVSNDVLGRTLFKLGHPEEALGFLLAAVALDPRNAVFLADLSAVQGALGKFPEAQKNLEEAIRLDPTHPHVRYTLGVFLLSHGNSADALTIFDQLLRLNIKEAPFYRSNGSALASYGLREHAVAHFKKSLEIDPGSTDTHARLGETLVESGKLEEGLGHLKKAVELDPGLKGLP